MTGLARLAIRHPQLAIAAWVAATACLGAASLGIVGAGLEERLVDTTLVVPGTESERAVELVREEFGQGVTIPVLLRGPARELDRQGSALVRAAPIPSPIPNGGCLRVVGCAAGERGSGRGKDAGGAA